MKRERALKGLFISVGLALVTFILREPLASIAASLVEGVTGTYQGWAQTAEAFFADRWAVALSVAAAVFFGYRLSSLRAERETGGE